MDWMAQEMWNTHISCAGGSRDPNCAEVAVNRELEDLEACVLLSLMISLGGGSPRKWARANTALSLWGRGLVMVRMQNTLGEVVAFY